MLRHLPLLLLFAAPAARGQGAPPDTIEWHRYFPLALGNVWEYQMRNDPENLHRWTLAAVVEEGGHVYYRREYVLAGSNHPTYVYYDYLRYDDRGFVVQLNAIGADPPGAGACALQPWVGDLRLGPGTRAPCPNGYEYNTLHVDVAYDTTWTPNRQVVPVPAVAAKRVFFDHYLGDRYDFVAVFVADVGLVSWGYSIHGPSGPLLLYALVGGVEYGERVLPIATTAESPPAPGAAALTVSPNPVTTAASVRLALRSQANVRVAAYDALGREVFLLHDGPIAEGATSLPLATSGWPPGVYVLRATAAAWSSTVRLVVSR